MTPESIQSALRGIDADIQPEHYEAALADLDGDGASDVLVLMNGQSGYSGSGGSTLFVFRCVEEALVQVGRIGVVRDPIYLCQGAHHGLRDLRVTVGGGGVEAGVARLEFDGERYPASAGAAGGAVEAGDEVVFAEPTPPLEETQTLLGVTFEVFSPNTRTGNRVTLTPSGLEVDTMPITVWVKGLITRVETADLNVDGAPEIYIYGFDGKSQTVLAYSANQKKSLSEVVMADLTAEEARGYRGGDEFAVVEGCLARRFPLYPDELAESKPTGRMRQLQYQLVRGEATWRLRVDKRVEF